MINKKYLLGLWLLIPIVSLADNNVTLSSFKKLKPLDSKSFTLLAFKKIGNQYMLTADMEYRGEHKIIDIFVSSDRKFVMFGNAFDTSTGEQHFSKQRLDAQLKVEKAWKDRQKSLKNYTYDPEPLKKMAAYKIGTGEKKYYVFTDFDCPFCKNIEKKFDNLKEDVTLYILPYPLEQLHPHSKAKSLKFMEMDKKEQEKLILNHKLSSIDIEGFQARIETEEKLKNLVKEGAKAHLTGTPFLLDSSGKKSNFDLIFN